LRNENLGLLLLDDFLRAQEAPEIGSLSDRALDLTLGRDDALGGLQGPMQFLGGNHNDTVVVADQPVAGANHLTATLHGNTNFTQVFRAAASGNHGPREHGK
jgi:hypothetical protein